MVQEQIDIKTPEYVSLQFKLAGLGSRASAMIIDQVILSIVNVIIVLIAMFTTTNDFMLVLEPGVFVAVAIIIVFGLYWGYFFVSEYFFGGKTIGKHLIGIRVIQENGHSVTLLSAIIRNLLRIIDMLPTSYFLGIILVFFHSKHQRLGDMAAGTIVVHERKAKANKKSPIEKEIEKRGLTKDSYPIEETVIRSLGEKEWNLVRTYSINLIELNEVSRRKLTKEMAEILLPKVNIEVHGILTDRKLEDVLLVLYLHMKEEWEFEL
ncbi:Uncharacterized membrane protein YckC, RDD family [Oceanobacillus limi]|uniref:Uncharacterized membrane protein YckC, RDD family n=1 Tax=Oceanobacillus limi TaxID=930131 RepID=A0A1I0F002_9BACI|nr:RDD family protein [Oceanobacillus limi]SET50709.1 Uncharacterized membrane protein YckC, RDD family [Oceanobacillus limi]